MAKRFLGLPAKVWVAVAVLVLVAAGVFAAVARRDIVVFYTLSGIDDDPAQGMDDIRALDLPYRPALERALLRGGRGYPAQMALTLVLLGEPYYGRAAVEQALASDEAVVSRSAAAALLRRDVTVPPGPVPDRVFAVLAEWVRDIHSPWLDSALAELGSYRDPRIPELLLPLALARSEDGTEGLSGNELMLRVGRANLNREQAVKSLRTYVPSAPRVVAGLEELVRREKEADLVQFEAWKSLSAGGYAGDPEIFWIAAKSTRVLDRQVVANNLEWVKDPRVVPILLYLAEDENEVARRGAINSLIAQRAPAVFDNIYFYGEDSYNPIRGDLATAVDIYGREEFVHFAAWCLTDDDPVVVEKAVVSLFRLTKTHFGFEEVWQDYVWNRYLEGGQEGEARSKIVKDFMVDAERKEKTLAAWADKYPPRYTDEARLPHLVRMLGHRDSRNVRRAIRELRRITGRDTGLPPEVLDPSAPVQAEADAVYRFMHGERDKVIADWQEWLKSR